MRRSAFTDVYAAYQRQRRAELAEQRRRQREYEQLIRAARVAAANARRQDRKLQEEALDRVTDLRNAQLADRAKELEGLLASGLGDDPYLDPARLRRVFVRPAFDPGAEGWPAREPVWEQFAPPPPAGLNKLMRAGEYERQLDAARARFAAAQEWYRRAEQDRVSRLQVRRESYERYCSQLRRQVDDHNATVDEWARRLDAGDPAAVQDMFVQVLCTRMYPTWFTSSFLVAYGSAGRRVVVEYTLPGFDVIPTVSRYRHVKSRGEITEVKHSSSERRTRYLEMIAQVALRTAHEIFAADRGRFVDVMVFNGVVAGADPATGRPSRRCLASLQVTPDELGSIDLRQVAPTACLQGLRSVVSRSPESLVEVRRYAEIPSTGAAGADGRLSGAEDIDLLELSPSEFEELVTQLFGAMGLTAVTTQASWDQGVDCIAVDDRPVVGGKLVIQAKRYRDRVGVEPVRALYGTMLSEGATKGVLVATSYFGPSAHRFVEGKPMDLIDGERLLALLKQHLSLEATIGGR